MQVIERTTVSGATQIFERFTSRREAFKDVSCYRGLVMDEDTTITIWTTDGHCLNFSEGDECYVPGQNRIERVLVDNGSSVQFYGAFTISQNERYGDWDIEE